MKKVRVVFFYIAFFLAIFSSNNIETYIVDEIHLITVLGYDLIEKDRLLGTAYVPQYGQDQQITEFQYSDEGSMAHEVVKKLNEQSSETLVAGKLEVLLLNEETAKEGVIKLIDSLQRDPTIGSNLNIAVFEGSTADALKKQYSYKGTGIYLSDLIRQNMESGILPDMNLKEFVYSYYEKGVDPYLPILKAQKDRIVVNGVGLFDEDKYVDKIDTEQTMLFKMLATRSGKGPFIFKDEENDGEDESSLRTRTKRKIKVEMKEQPKVTLHVKVEASIEEYKQQEVTNKVLKRLEKKITKKIKSDGEELIKRFQEHGIDPLEISAYVRSKDRNWDEKKWDDIYPSLEIEVKPEVNITESGVIR
ncbi:Ger(x)C family spore germination protein [Salirhabdus salicampi]|uniref:Ger(x)C family spore germination protein n=1 Tax=Salirhabdus salicampi TaxID=476102 RepID=UPI0020C34B8B|nr:Ger(x)C family spore germination protein [Salirhabdus salicampi]MCP8615595.1 Ger(x)C family spore germination protein [Salirhabdus salicampi]